MVRGGPDLFHNGSDVLELVLRADLLHRRWTLRRAAGAFAIAESSVTAGLSSCTQISGTGRDGRTHFACAFIAIASKRGSTLSSFPRSPNSGLQRQLCRDIQLHAFFRTTDRPTNRPTDQAMHASTPLQKLTFIHRPSQRTLCTQSRAYSGRGRRP